MQEPSVHILANRSGTCSRGVTSDLQRRIHEQIESTIQGFTSQDNVTLPVCFDRFPTMPAASIRETFSRRLSAASRGLKR